MYPLIFLIELILLAGVQADEMSDGGSEEVLPQASPDIPEIKRQDSKLPLGVRTTPREYILTATLGPHFSSNLITITSKKRHRLLIVADRDDHSPNCE